MQIHRILKGTGTFFGSLAATAIAVQGVAAFFSGVTIPLFQSAPEDNIDIPQTSPSDAPSFSEPALVTNERKAAKTVSDSNISAPKQIEQITTTVPVQKFAPISLPTEIAAPTNATSGGSGVTGANGASTSTGTWTSNATSGGSGSNSSGSNSGSSSGGKESHERHGGNLERENDDD